MKLLILIVSQKKGYLGNRFKDWLEMGLMKVELMEGRVTKSETR